MMTPVVKFNRHHDRMTNSPVVVCRLQKLVKDLTKYLQTDDRGPWPQHKVSALDRAVGEIGRIMEKKVGRACDNFHQGGRIVN